MVKDLDHSLLMIEFQMAPYIVGRFEHESGSFLQLEGPQILFDMDNSRVRFLVENASYIICESNIVSPRKLVVTILDKYGILARCRAIDH
jgi:hypothetical protein